MVGLLLGPGSEVFHQICKALEVGATRRWLLFAYARQGLAHLLSELLELKIERELFVALYSEAEDTHILGTAEFPYTIAKGAGAQHCI